MSLTDISNDLKSIKDRLDKQDAKQLEESSKDKKKKWKIFRFKGKIKSKAKKSIKEGKILVVYLRNNRSIDFFWVLPVMGLIDIDPTKQPIKVTPLHGFEPGSVYSYNNKWPTMVIPEWRLLPVGGVVEEAEREGVCFGGDTDKDNAAFLKIGTTAELVLANMMEKKELETGVGKKGNWGWLLWVGVGLVGVYILAKVFGWM